VIFGSPMASKLGSNTMNGSSPPRSRSEPGIEKSTGQRAAQEHGTRWRTEPGFERATADVSKRVRFGAAHLAFFLTRRVAFRALRARAPIARTKPWHSRHPCGSERRERGAGLGQGRGIASIARKDELVASNQLQQIPGALQIVRDFSARSARDDFLGAVPAFTVRERTGGVEDRAKG